jgi:hypothetical protein
MTMITTGWSAPISVTSRTRLVDGGNAVAAPDAKNALRRTRVTTTGRVRHPARAT